MSTAIQWKDMQHNAAQIDAAVDAANSHIADTAVHMSAAEKAKLASLENYDDTEVRGLIAAEETNREAECGAIANAGAKNYCPYNSITATASSTPLNDQPINLPAGTYVLSFTQTATTGASSIRFSYNGTSVANFTINNDETLTKSREFTLTSSANQIKLYTSVANTYTEIMIRRKEITDATYQPYAPTNRELYEMILALQPQNSAQSLQTLNAPVSTALRPDVIGEESDDA